MTIKKANKLIKKYTKEIIKADVESKVDKIDRKIQILKDFIYFQREMSL
jgi:hypothetical protein